MTVIEASNTVQYSSNGNSFHNLTVYTKVKELTMTDNYTGSWRIAFVISTADALDTAYGKIYKNGVAYGTERSTSLSTPQLFTEDFTSISISSGDLIQLYTKVVSGSDDVINTTFEDKFTLPPPSVSQSNMLLML